MSHVAHNESLVRVIHIDSNLKCKGRNCRHYDRLYIKCLLETSDDVNFISALVIVYITTDLHMLSAYIHVYDVTI